MQCSNCQHENSVRANYCGRCGQKIVRARDQSDYQRSVKKISAFFFLTLAYIVVVYFTEFGGTYVHFLIGDVVLASITVVFYLMDYRAINRLFKFGHLQRTILLRILIIAPILAVLVWYLVGLMNESLFDEAQFAYYDFFRDSPAPIALSLLSIALFPALFEEIAFRGVVFNELNQITGIKAAIIISTILFTIIHLSVLSFFWIFPIGLVFGFLRAKHRTLWYGIVGHFVYNGSIVMVEVIVSTTV